MSINRADVPARVHQLAEVKDVVDRRLAFKDAMSSFPSGVTIVTTSDRDGLWRGFTATSFCSVSMDPPLVLVCLATTAECHEAFQAAERWNVHVITPTDAGLALQFATRGADKFGTAPFEVDQHGLPLLTTSCVVLACSAFDKVDGGDHTILIGRVEDCLVSSEQPAVYYRRSFHDLAPADEEL